MKLSRYGEVNGLKVCWGMELLMYVLDGHQVSLQILVIVMLNSCVNKEFTQSKLGILSAIFDSLQSNYNQLSFRPAILFVLLLFKILMFKFHYLLSYEYFILR